MQAFGGNRDVSETVKMLIKARGCAKITTTVNFILLMALP